MRNLKERGVAFGFHNHAYSLIKNRKGKKEVDARMWKLTPGFLANYSFLIQILYSLYFYFYQSY